MVKNYRFGVIIEPKQQTGGNITTNVWFLTDKRVVCLLQSRRVVLLTLTIRRIVSEYDRSFIGRGLEPTDLQPVA